jgi:hypothetical protein
MTAAQLFAALQPYGVAVEGGGLAYDADAPPDLERVLDAALHTGVRAVLSGRRWFGSTSSDGRSQKNPRVVELDPQKPLPRDTALLCVEGDDRWDRVHPAAHIDCPDIFKPEKVTTTIPASENRP